jgi:hypothetical protein
MKCLKCHVPISPEAALWQLKQTGSQVHADVRERLETYFSRQVHK